MTALSLQVWNALRRPPIHHPLFRRARQIPVMIEPHRPPLVRRLAVTALFAVVLYLCVRYFSQVIFVIILFVPLGLTALYMALHGTIAGLYWAVRVSSAIARERERGTYDLLSTSPYGAFSASWAICTGCQYYDQTFNGAGAQRVWYSRIFFLTLLLLTAIISLANPRIQTLEGFLYIVEVVVILAVAFYLDDIQSTVIGSLVGLIVPLFARNRLDARVGAFAGFLVLQVGAYALVALIDFVWLPQVSAALDSGAAEFALPVGQFAVFFAMRELIARVLWRLNALLHDGDVSDLRLLTKGGRLIC
jgi:hypothetical protein